jgi:hypothetical protein
VKDSLGEAPLEGGIRDRERLSKGEEETVTIPANISPFLEKASRSMKHDVEDIGVSFEDVFEAIDVLEEWRYVGAAPTSERERCQHRLRATGTS